MKVKYYEFLQPFKIGVNEIPKSAKRILERKKALELIQKGIVKEVILGVKLTEVSKPETTNETKNSKA